jgi:hypothetical protein
MKCSQIEKKIAVSEPLTAADTKHVQTCATCAAFLRDAAALKSSPKIETPAHLKSRTLRMSLQQLAADHQPEKSSYFKRLWQTPRAALILTGFSILALFVTFLYQLGCDPSDLFCRVSSFFLILILAQNIIAALCLPLLIQHKNNLYYKW